jgi:cytochrome P450
MTEQHDFYALSRYHDVEYVLGERERFISGRGETLDVLQTGTPSPPGLFINEDGPEHAMHRALVSILITPRAISALEPHVPRFCADILDSMAGATKDRASHGRSDDEVARLRVRGHHRQHASVDA